MSSVFLSVSLASPDDTTALAARFGARLKIGDVILLEGDIGAGKTHFARSLIQSVQHVPEDVPSPTFTLVQTYETAIGPIWHADLYRLGGPDDVTETGLEDAMQDAICLIEWPDRLGPEAPPLALTMTFEQTGENARKIDFSSPSKAHWSERLEASI